MKNVPAIEFNREGLVGKIQRYSLIPNAMFLGSRTFAGALLEVALTLRT